MTIGVTLITPPDIYQNDKSSIMLIDIPFEEQEDVSLWLGNRSENIDINIYFYQGEFNAPWFLHSMACCNHKYINLDHASPMSKNLASYLLSKNNVFYSTSDKNLSELYSHINLNKVSNAIEFLERIFSGK